MSFDNNLPLLLSNWKNLSQEVKQVHSLLVGEVEGSLIYDLKGPTPWLLLLLLVQHSLLLLWDK